MQEAPGSECLHPSKVRVGNAAGLPTQIYVGSVVQLRQSLLQPVLAPQASVPSLGESSGGSLWPCLAWLQSVNLGLEDQAGLWCLNKGCPQD